MRNQEMACLLAMDTADVALSHRVAGSMGSLRGAPCRPMCKTLAKLGDGAPGIFRGHIPASYLRPSVPPPYAVHCLGLLQVRARNTRDDWWYLLVGLRCATPASGSPCRREPPGASPLARSGFHARRTIARNVWLPLAVMLRTI